MLAPITTIKTFQLINVRNVGNGVASAINQYAQLVVLAICIQDNAITNALPNISLITNFQSVNPV